MNLVSVDPDNTDMLLALYQLLAERPAVACISHRKMPTLDEHIAFVQSEPYLAWYMIEDGQRYAGAVYLTHAREIGIGILEKYQRQGLGLAAVRELMRRHPGDRFLANIAPSNERSRRLFEKLGATLIQTTYEL